MKYTGYMNAAREFASQHSDDEQCQVGAVLVSPSGDCVFGTNRLPRLVRRRPERIDPKVKGLFLEHAERDAIFAAARLALPVSSWTLYSTKPLCADCARAALQAGVKHVVAPAVTKKDLEGKWGQSMLAARDMLHEAGVFLTELKVAPELQGGN